MRFERQRRTRDDERVLPLVNIVFLLLIFFMLAGRLAVPDPFGVEPPHSASRSAADGHETMTVLMAANGRLALDGKVVEQARLKSDVAKRLADDGTTPVRLMADGRAEARQVVAVIDLLQRSGVKNLRLRTVPSVLSRK